MLNHETIKFISMLEKLARLSKNGIDRFENATEENYYSMVFYDASKADSNGLYRIVLDAIYHSYDSSTDIISYYDSDTSDYSVRVNADDEEDVFIVVSFPDQSYQIVIEKGKWYAV